MSKFLRSFSRDERGISSIEYAMLAVGIALAILAGAQFLGNSINSGLSTIGTDITTDLSSAGSAGSGGSGGASTR